MNITVLSGEIGGARFTRGLPRALVPTAGNHGDREHRRRRVAARRPHLPETSRTRFMYTLGGAVHEEQGWGRREESGRTSDDLAAYGLGWEWFTLGKKRPRHPPRPHRAAPCRAPAVAGDGPARGPLGAGRHAAADDGRRGGDARRASPKSSTSQSCTSRSGGSGTGRPCPPRTSCRRTWRRRPPRRVSWRRSPTRTSSSFRRPTRWSRWARSSPCRASATPCARPSLPSSGSARSSAGSPCAGWPTRA